MARLFCVLAFFICASAASATSSNEPVYAAVARRSRADGLTPESFRATYLSSETPVVITDAVQPEWPIAQWKSVADVEASLVGSGCAPSGAFLAGGVPSATMQISEAGAVLQDDPSALVVVGDVCPGQSSATHGLYERPYFDSSPSELPTSETLFVTSPNTSHRRGAEGHVDTECGCSWSLQLAGTKVWELRSPLRQGQFYRTVVHPGEAIFWCSGWWHRTSASVVYTLQ